MLKKPSITIITAVRNGADTIADCLNSVKSQKISVEHIIVDGCSFDLTLNIVNLISPQARVISEQDDGIYDAMNKGIKMASGDIIGILNADDFYVDDKVLANVVDIFDTQPIDALFADLVFVKPTNINKVVRYYSGANFTLSRFASGWMPPHPTFFVRRGCYEKYGIFNTSYKIAADFDLMARLLVRHKIRYQYFPQVIVKMRTGGVSTKNFKSNFILNAEIMKSCIDNGISTNFLKVYSKYLSKWTQLFLRPK